jgi:hypothetical protein
MNEVDYYLLLGLVPTKGDELESVFLPCQILYSLEAYDIRLEPIL